MSTTALLRTRGETHGSFADNSLYAQTLRAFWRTAPSWETMPAEHREALDMIACKLSRILSGQSRTEDHWADIAGYAELARKVCETPSDAVEVAPGIWRAKDSTSIFKP